MLIAFLSDLHGNIPALHAVIADVRSQSPEMIICLGDIVGYYPNPSECITIAKTFDQIIKGNHDAFASTGSIPILFNEHARKATMWTFETLPIEERQFLHSLELFASMKIDCSVYLVHGSPSYPLEEYIYPNTAEQLALFEFMELCDIDILALGHTHVPFLERLEKSQRPTRLMINPGSVGQPRDGDPRASYALVDTETLNGRIRRVEYDFEETIQRVINAGLPQTLADRLRMGL